GGWTPTPGSLGAQTPRPPHRDDCQSRAGRKKGALPQELRRLQSLLARGVGDTADVWPDVRVGERWVHQAAPILRHQDQRDTLTGERRLGGLLGAMTRHPTAAGTLAPALEHCRKVTRSDWPGLFPC